MNNDEDRQRSEIGISMEIEQAIKIADLWRAGKMIGGDEDRVRNTLLGEVERLRALLDLITNKES